MQLFLELASRGTGERDSGYIYIHWIQRWPSSGPEALDGWTVPPRAQLLGCFDTAFPARSAGFAGVRAPIWKRRDGVGWRVKNLGPHSEQSVLFFFLPIEGFLASDGGRRGGAWGETP